MKRDQRRALVKKARFERSRRENHWDGREVVERVFPLRESEPVPVERRIPTIVEGLLGYMREIGVQLPVIDIPPPVKEAEVIPPCPVGSIESRMESDGVAVVTHMRPDGSGTNYVTPKHQAKLIMVDHFLPGCTRVSTP